VERHFAKASLPSGLVLFMPSSLIELIIFSVYAATIYNVEASLTWYFFLLFLTVVLSMASPPVAGVSLISFMTIFAQLGIPKPALVAGMIADIIFGVIAGGFNQAILQLELVLQAAPIGLVSEKVICREAQKS
jgi:Na+/H+-dicarboxylate symporter